MKTEELIARVREMRCLVAIGKFALINIEEADRLADEICSRLESLREAMRRARKSLHAYSDVSACEAIDEELDK